MTEAKTLKHEFRGKTKSDIQVKYREWQHENAGKICRPQKEHPIKHLPLKMQNTKFGPMGETPDGFLMLVEYEIILRGLHPVRMTRG